MPADDGPSLPPVFLHHGLFGYDSKGVGRFRWAYFQGIDKALRRAGYTVCPTKVHPTGGVARRAAELKTFIVDALNGMGLPADTRVLLVGHSMGGLDARYMVSKLGMEDRVSAVLTVTCPHRGTPYADWCVRHFGKRLGGFELMQMLGIDVQGIRDVTTDGCARFNEEVPDVPG
ncbi:MAG: esterase/lipase family protein, partial [Phycisphaerae bacterium]